MTRRLTVAAGFVALGVVLAACTSTSSTGSTTSSAPSASSAAPAAVGSSGVKIGVVVHGAVGDQFWSDVKDGVTEDAFVAMRETRDAKLAAPLLLMPSIQVNMRAGQLPPPDANGVRYIRVPVTLPVG